jgi:hypothetical protein
MIRVGAILALALVPAMAEEGFTPLFDGKTLSGWKLVAGHGRGYVVEGGNLVCPADGGGNLFTEREFSNFIVRVEFKLGPDGNNGIGIRAPLDGHTSVNGMEVQIIDDKGPEYSKAGLRPEQLHGSLYDMIPARQGFLKVGEWNTQEVFIQGRHLRVTVNGVIVLDTSLDIIREPEVLKKHPGLQRKSGHIGFLGHGTRIEFRNIRVKEL